MKATLSERIKLLRSKIGLSQVEFSQRLGVTKQCVSNWENDNVMPSIEMLIKLSDFFKVSTDYLLGRETDKVLEADGLTSEQTMHIRLVIKDLVAANNRVTVFKKRGFFDPTDRS